MCMLAVNVFLFIELFNSNFPFTNNFSTCRFYSHNRTYAVLVLNYRLY